MLDKEIEKLLNEQINAEFYSAYLYLSVSSCLSSNNLNGFASWMKVQFEEEQAHAEKLYDYVLERGGKVELAAIAKPDYEWNGIIDVFKFTLAHEQKVTASINNITSIAIDKKDHATVNFLQWFIDEQVEEEATVMDMLSQLELIEGKGTALFMLDREAKQRVFQPIN